MTYSSIWFSLAGVSLIIAPLVLAHNYDAYLDHVANRNKRLLNSFNEISGDVPADGSQFRAEDVLNSDGDEAEQWENLLRRIDNHRQERRSQLVELERRIPDLLRPHESNYYEEPAGGTYYSLLQPSGSDDDEDESSMNMVEAARRGAVGGTNGRSERDEMMFQNYLWGEHRVSGGNGKPDASQLNSQSSQIKPTEQQAPMGKTPDANDASGRSSKVKTDSLPGYCNPPNPCPVGMDPSSAPSPCDKHIENTKEFNRRWNWNKMVRGECTCDQEHMNSCPKVSSGHADPVNGEEDQTSNYYYNFKQQAEHRAIKKKAGPRMFNQINM